MVSYGLLCQQIHRGRDGRAQYPPHCARLVFYMLSKRTVLMTGVLLGLTLSYRYALYSTAEDGN
jgi:hypothetical protein